MGQGQFTDFDKDFRAVKVESGVGFPGQFIFVCAVHPNQSGDGSLPHDSDVDPRAVDLSLAWVQISLGVLDKLLELLVHVAKCDVKSALREAILDHVAVENFISDDHCLGDASDLGRNMPLFIG